jgi:hypothetical protein
MVNLDNVVNLVLVVNLALVVLKVNQVHRVLLVLLDVYSTQVILHLNHVVGYRVASSFKTINLNGLHI